MATSNASSAVFVTGFGVVAGTGVVDGLVVLMGCLPNFAQKSVALRPLALIAAAHASLAARESFVAWVEVESCRHFAMSA